MFRRYKLSICATFACVILGAQAPSAEGVTGPSPAPKEQAQQAAQNGPDDKKSVAVTVVESAEQKIAGERREAEGREHDARDLDAQIRAANAAEQQIFPSWLGAILSFVGTTLIIWTLLETRKSTAAAEVAAKSAQDAVASDRAWILPDGFKWGPMANSLVNGKTVTNGFVIYPVWKNYGRSPAINMQVYRNFKVIPIDDPVPDLVLDWAVVGEEAERGAAVLGPGNKFSMQAIILDDEQTAQFREQSCKVAIFSFVRYNDVFGNTIRQSQSCMQAVHQGGTMSENGGASAESVNFGPIGGQDTAI